jgi:hypothetical protein
VIVQAIAKVPVTFPDFTGGIASHDFERTDILGHHGTSSHNGPLPDRNSRQNDGPVTDPDMVSNHDIASPVREF